MDKFHPLRSKAERLIHQAKQNEERIQPEDIQNILHELEVYRIELEIQDEELREAQLALTRSRKEFLDLFELAPIGYAVLDDKTGIIRLNSKGAQLFGTDKEYLLHKRLDSFAYPPGIAFRKYLNGMLSDGKPIKMEVKFIRKGGNYFWARLEFSLWNDAEKTEDQGIRILCGIVDITEQKHAEIELIQYRNHLEELIATRTEELEAANQRLRDEIDMRIQSEEQLVESLKEKEVLLREIHHRVKNNLQVIVSLLRLQARKIDNHQVSEIFKESQNRIQAMALIHETLCKQKLLSRIDLKDYLSRLGSTLVRVYSTPISRVHLNIEVENILLNIDQAIPCGLIINELISNALKHAFPNGRNGEIHISAKSAGEDQVELVVRDNGIGLPTGLDLNNADTMGFVTVEGLAKRQLEATVDIRRENGTAFVIRFEKWGETRSYDKGS